MYIYILILYIIYIYANICLYICLHIYINIYIYRKSIPYSQLLRIKRICSTKKDFGHLLREN